MIPTWVKQDSYQKVTQVVSGGKPVIRGGKECVLLGKKVDKRSGVEGAGIMTWVDKEQLRVVRGKSNVEMKEQEVVDGKRKLYRVQVGAFAHRSNAERLVGQLHASGFQGVIVG